MLRQAGPVKLACAGFILAYFLWFAWDGLWAHFAADDMMNMAGYWNRGPLRLLAAQLAFFSDYYRPMGGLFYMPIFYFAGLNPLPYRVAILLLLVANIYLLYRFAALLSGSEAVGGIAALLGAYHGKTLDLYCQTATVYDVLCFFFFFAALVYYFRIRAGQRTLTTLETVIFLLLYVCALNSKEMAVTLPALVLAYELFYHPPVQWRLPELRRWLVAQGRPAVLAGVLTAVYVVGKVSGPEALTIMPAYKPVITLANFLRSNVRYLNDIWYLGDFFNWKRLLLLWGVLAYVAWRLRKPHLRFCACYVVLSTLPIAFIPVRAWSCLYIPVAGWALVAATIAWYLVNFLAAEPPFRRLPLPIVRTLLLAGGVALLAHETALYKRRYQPMMLASQERTWFAIQQMRELNPKVAPHSRVLFLNDPFETWDMVFIAQLYFRDRTLDISLLRKLDPKPDETQISSFDYIFRFDGGRLVQVKP